MSLFDDASLAMIPSAYKDGKLYSIKPSDGSGDFTFTRGSNLAATRVDVNGLIEKGRENLLLQSNQFDTTWTTSDASVTSGQTGYDGSSDAWLLQDTASTAEHRVRQTPSQYDVQTLSVYAKANTLDFLWLRGVNSGTNVRAFFNLSSGTLGTSSGTLIDYNIESVGSGWYRCSMTLEQQTGFEYYIGLTNADGSASYTGTGSGSIYIQDAQLEQGLVATDYIETTTTTAQAGILEDMPRLDYSGGASCPSLLLEPQRSNLVTNSEYFNGSGWQKLASGTALIPVVTINQGLSPDGENNASKVVFDRGAGTTSSDFSRLYFSSGSAPATASIYVKSFDGTHYDMYLVCGNAFNAISVTNEWQRFDVTELTTGSNIQLRLQGNLGSESNAEVLIYGAQLEQGSYPTSYIPTYGTSQSRSQDACYKTGVSDLIGQTEGTIFFEWSKDVLNFGSDFSYFQVGSYPNYVGIYIQASNCICEVVNAGVVQAKITKSSVSIGTHKAAVAYANNDIAFYFDGVQVGADSSATIPATSQVYLNSNNGIAEKIKQTLLFKTRLTNAELAALTTL